VTTHYVAHLFKAAGVVMVMTRDSHILAAFKNAIRRRTLDLSNDRLFAMRIAAQDSKQPPGKRARIPVV